MVMSRRRLIFQLIGGAIIFISYMQFHLFTYSERRLFLKRVALVLPGEPKVPFQKACFRPYKKLQHFQKGEKGLALLTWSSDYIRDTRSLIDHPLFPKHSNSLLFNVKSSLQMQFERPVGIWLFGMLFAAETGGHRFAISASSEAMLRLSSTDEPDKYRTIASVSKQDQLSSNQFDKYSSQTSVSIHLEQCRKYFIEVLCYNKHEKLGHLQIAWETPSSLRYEVIPQLFLRPYIASQDIAYTANNLVFFKDTITMINLFSRFLHQKQHREKLDLPLPFMSELHAFRGLTHCLPQMGGASYGPRLQISTEINEKNGLKVIEKYIQKLVKTSEGKYTYRSLHSSEVKSLGDEGTRYLLNVEFTDNIMDINIRISEYLFYDNSEMKLCIIKQFKWRRDALVTIVHVIKEKNRWSQYFVEQLYTLSTELRDARLDIILVTSNSLREFTEMILSNIAIAWHSRLTLLNLDDNTLLNVESVMEKAVERVDKGIIFFTHSRMEIPTKILEDIRKKTIEGKTLFIPWPDNFEKGYNEGAPIINPLDSSNIDRAPSFAIHASDWRKLNAQKSGSEREDVASNTGDWWLAVGNGALEIYVSKIPNLLYYPKGSEELPESNSTTPRENGNPY